MHPIIIFIIYIKYTSKAVMTVSMTIRKERVQKINEDLKSKII